LIALAESATNAQLAAQLRGLSASDAKAKIHCMTLYFTDTQYTELSAALVKHGAIKTAPGLSGKEKALMRALSQ
jgi:hypothetical protein